ncbi:hypothetical protein Tco_0303936 [Tanacetum coccineum]
MDGNHITGRMLLAKIESKEFDTLDNEDSVGVCLLAILKLVLLGHEPRHNVPDWCLRNANVKWWEVFYATTIELDSPLPKYSLIGFTWAFKGARPHQRLTPDAFEAQAEWWVSSRAFFEGRICEPPRIPSPVNQHSREDVLEDIYRHMAEQDRLLKEAQDKVDAHDSTINQMNVFLKGIQVGTMPRPMKGPTDVREHYGLSDFSVFQNNQGGPTIFTTHPCNSFFDGAQMTLTYPALFDQPMSSRYSSSYLTTPHIMTPRAQQGFVLWSSTYQATFDPRPQYGSSHNHDVGGVILDVMNRERRESRPSIFLQSPCMPLPATTVAPKKRVDKSRNKTRNVDVLTFDLGNEVVDDNAVDDEVMIMGARATDDYVLFENVDPNKVKRERYVECMKFLFNPNLFFWTAILRVIELWNPSGEN